ncbi:tRNA pseudouridine(55) synthase TruB [Patescibacteria group bacterium]|nr:tRNA pseudouridine(55) synthase TruB [Patescibacteria group bacterium]MBU1016008.1 tRNA pseudouridine(55) synthase TruB [Patescibacteria group bacterium]MBU1684633.1 tRNA pseudouridine(55) synthase TruB [Patescibacteria group bacterium]MBU1939073.1 tRNA pseudouridine(55) synthase TruB [Patescibacteria group bacterium]
MTPIIFQKTDGLLVIDKPKGWTSFDVVAKIRNKLGVKKIGHTGTLDPMATGVLVLCLGKATKLAQEMTAYDKEYIAEITLGATTPTDDAEGVITPFPGAKKKSKNEILTALKYFEGEIMQLPPRFSAKKVKGKRAYAMARKGQEFKLEPVKVNVHEIELLSYKWPTIRLRVLSSKGFYVRSLARELGEKLGTGGYLSALQRSKVGKFNLSHATTIEEASAKDVLPI